MLRPYYREFDLAWTFPEEDAERFRKILLWVLLIFLLLGILIPLLPTPQRDEAAWHAIGEVITRNDPYCRGIVLLGLEAPESELEAAFAAAAKEPQVKGFAVGRTIFNDAARRWLKGEISDEAAISDMASRFQRLVEAWQRVSAHVKAA